MTTTALGARSGLPRRLGGGVERTGAVAGGNVGLTVGLAILDWFGLAFLAIYIGSGLGHRPGLSARDSHSPDI